MTIEDRKKTVVNSLEAVKKALTAVQYQVSNADSAQKTEDAHRALSAAYWSVNDCLDNVARIHREFSSREQITFMRGMYEFND